MDNLRRFQQNVATRCGRWQRRPPPRRSRVGLAGRRVPGLGVRLGQPGPGQRRPAAQGWSSPFVLSVPGEAMLLDPAGLSPDEVRTRDVPPLPGDPYELREPSAGGASWYGARFHRRRTASGELF